MTLVRSTFTVSLLLSFSASLFGQNITSSVLGTVVDPAGAAVVGRGSSEFQSEHRKLESRD